MAENVEEKLNALVGRVGKVRRWLMMLAILKVAALCFIFVSVFIGFYAWLDHRFIFNETGRIIAFIMLIAGLAFLLHRLTKLLISHVSYSIAASYIENKNTFNQQLVTAIEYYENKQDYPYSKSLAEQLVLRVEKESEEFEFDSTIEKWQGYALGAVILFGLVAAAFYVRDNYVYFSSYFARLTRPLASIEPMSPTHFESITKDIVAEPDSDVKFAAEIEGRVPEMGKLVLVELKPEAAGGSSEQQRQEIQIRPRPYEGKTTRFEAAKSFSQPGKFKYRFETDSAKGEWHELNISYAPSIESMTAKVAMPRRPPRNKWIKSYTEQIENNTLQVIPGSNVTLSVQATDKLSKMTATGPDDRPITRQLNGAKELEFNFTADRNGSVKFSLVSEQGLINDNVPDLQVIVKTDEPPKFKLVSPDGDYLATNVASVPVTFEVTDDFGLESVKLHMEIAGRKSKEMEIPVEEGARTIEFIRTIELEEYELSAGDSILFYADATDIDTGSEPASSTSSSDVYFIEIRPYRQNWAPLPGGRPSQGAGLPPVELLNILEYTRAIIKKTWAIASKPELTDEDRSRLGFINQDVQYCAEQVTLIRDDSQYGFEEPHKAVLNEVIWYYKQASGHLAAYDAASAMAPEKDAYRVLRKFILELELAWSPPSSGNSPQPKKPDSVKLQEKPEFTGYEKERIEGQLKKMQQKLDKLTREQKELKWSFENFLEHQAEKKAVQQNLDASLVKKDVEKQAQKPANAMQQGETAEQKGENGSEEQSASGGKGASDKQNPSDKNKAAGKSTEGSETPGEERNDTGSFESKQDQSSGKGENASEGQGSIGRMGKSFAHVESGNPAAQSQSSGQAEKTAWAGEPAHPTTSNAQRQSNGQDGNAGAEVILRMLQAKQRAVQQQVSQLKRELEVLPEESSDSGKGKGRAQAQEHLSKAAARMEDFQNQIAEARYRAEIDKQKSNKVVALMDSARRELDLAKEVLDGGVTLSDKEKLEQEAQEMAEQLAEDADALDESVSPQEREDMLARLEAARRLLKTMPEPQWTTVSRGGRTGAGLVLTRNPNLAPAESARQMARQFWSIAINAKKRGSQRIDDEPSDVEFYGQENKFFENAAEYNAEPVKK
jgi:hypothetical protein